MRLKQGFAASLCAAVVGLAFAMSPGQKEQPLSPTARIFGANTIHVATFDLPPSDFLSAETLAVLKAQTREYEEIAKDCPGLFGEASSREEILSLRACDDKYRAPGVIGRQHARYNVVIKSVKIGGVSTETFMPAETIPVKNQQRVLINLHGGGFRMMAGWGGEQESIPISYVGKIKVISVDYRMAPEYQFPAASQDVASVYKALLHDYKPENIGIYGCSAGGILAAESVAWFQKEGLPAPGAIGMFCGAAFDYNTGDSSIFLNAVGGVENSGGIQAVALSYFRELDFKNPLAFPGLAPQMMARFPPSLLLTATRDSVMSSVLATHSQLVRLGVITELHVWEGLPHCFLFEPELPESREAYDVIVHFFDEHLGKAK